MSSFFSVYIACWEKARAVPRFYLEVQKGNRHLLFLGTKGAGPLAVGAEWERGGLSQES